MIILGVRIDNLTKVESLKKISEFLNYNKARKIFTPNPEMLVDARKDEYFKDILNGGDLNICDGFGLWLSVRLSSRAKRSGAEGSLLERITGVDLMLDICELAEKESKSIYLLGSGSDEVVKKTTEVLQQKFPLLKIAGYNRGLQIIKLSNYQINYNKDENEDAIYDIIVKAPDILFVAFGHGKQEKWIHENLVDLPSVKVAMGVGGSFDFISGKTKRAPVWMRKIGFEWLWRLICQPKRVGRIWKAVVVFIFLNLRNKKQETNKSQITNYKS